MNCKKNINVSNNISSDIQKIIENIEIDDSTICTRPNTNYIEDKYKFVSIMNAENDLIVDIPRETSNLIIGGICEVVDFNLIKINKFVYCVDNDNLQMGVYIKQSNMFPCYSIMDDKPTYTTTIGKIIHIYNDNIYITQDMQLKTKEEYIKSLISKIDINKTKHILDIKARDLPSVSVRRVNSNTRQTYVQTPKPSIQNTLKRTTSTTTNTKNNSKIYKLTLVKYILLHSESFARVEKIGFYFFFSLVLQLE